MMNSSVSLLSLHQLACDIQSHQRAWLMVDFCIFPTYFIMSRLITHFRGKERNIDRHAADGWLKVAPPLYAIWCLKGSDTNHLTDHILIRTGCKLLIYYIYLYLYISFFPTNKQECTTETDLEGKKQRKDGGNEVERMRDRRKTQKTVYVYVYIHIYI